MVVVIYAAVRAAAFSHAAAQIKMGENNISLCRIVNGSEAGLASSCCQPAAPLAAAMGGNPFTWPAGVYLSDGKFNHILMAMETILDRSGVHYNPVYGTPEEDKELERSYKHLCDLRDEVIAMGIIPPVSEWNKLNKNIE